MTDGMIMAIGGFLVMALALVKPIINLNTNITELKMSIDQFKESINRLDSRITAHGQELEAVRTKLADHEARISTLEKE